ncbi:MAG: ATP-binding protein [Ruminococcus sp.]
MAINLLDIEPTVVSRDLRGKIVMFYGEPKTGKTTTAVKFPKSLLLAFEKGYNALNNVMAQPINKWSEFKQVLKQLKEPGVQAKFETIIVDTADIMWDLAEKYVVQRESVEKIGDIPFGGGYKMVESEVDECLRSIALMDYGLVMISHAEDKEFTDESGESYQKIVPTLPKKARKIVTRMADIIGYSRTIQDEEGNTTVNLYMRGTPRFEAGSRWKHTPQVIEFNYQNLVDAIADAIDKQEKEDGVTATDTHVNLYKETSKYDFSDVKQEINATIKSILEEDEDNATKITKIVDKHLGKGRRIAEAEEEQVDMLVLILDDLKELISE